MRVRAHYLQDRFRVAVRRAVFRQHSPDLPDLPLRFRGGTAGFRRSPDLRVGRNSAPHALRCSITVRRSELLSPDSVACGTRGQGFGVPCFLSGRGGGLGVVASSPWYRHVNE